MLSQSPRPIVITYTEMPESDGHAIIGKVSDMTRSVRNIAALVVAALMIAALLVPVAAFAGPGPGQATGASDTSATAPGYPAPDTNDEGEMINRFRERVGQVMQRRARRFESALKAMTQTRTRLEGIVDDLEALGAEVEPLRTRLEACEQLLVQARQQEAVATQLFRGIADSEDRYGAFVQAKIQARNGVALMTQARHQIRVALDEIEEIADELVEEGDVE